MSSHPRSSAGCGYCGHPIARGRLAFSNPRRSHEVSCTLHLCNACAERVEYHLQIALSSRLLDRSAVA